MIASPSAGESTSEAPVAPPPVDSSGPAVMTVHGLLARLFWRFKGHYLLFAYLAIQGWVIYLSYAFLHREYIATLTGTGAQLALGIYGIAVVFLVAELARVTGIPEHSNGQPGANA